MVDWYVRTVPDDPAKRRKLFVAAAVGVVFVVALGAFLAAGPADSHETLIPVSTELSEPTESTVFVHVAGLVNNPGVYELPVDARVFDAIAAAGGLAPTADSATINLARIIQDGEQIVVGATGAGAQATSPGKTNINRATADDFDTLPRIGPTLAERIVAYRDKHGPFASIDALGDVPGIGDVTLAGIRDQLTL